LIGGVLARPADHHWRMFDGRFWRAFPYFLPCATAAAVSLTAFFVGLLWLKETAPTVVVKRHRAKSLKQPRKLRLSQSESTPLLDDHQPPPAVESPPLSALLTAPVLTAVLNYSLLALSEISLTAIIPVYLASSPLSLTPWAIGVFMGGMGIANGVFQALCTAALVERWGAKRIYQVAICAFFPLWALFPLAVNVASATDAGPHQWTVWLLAVLGVVLVTIVEMSFSTIFLFVRSASPTPAALGATNGIAQTMASLMRTVGPASATSLFAVSREHELLGGYLVYAVLLPIAAVTLAASFLLPEM